MRNILYTLITTAVLGSCNNNPALEAPATTATVDKAVVDTPVNSITCYWFKSYGLEVKLHAEQYGKDVTGTLRYDFADKDDNEGLIKGNYYGDTLIVAYTFKAEGTTSTRDVAFIKQGKQLIEGYGDVEEMQGKMAFKNRSKLNFSGPILQQVPCKE